MVTYNSNREAIKIGIILFVHINALFVTYIYIYYISYLQQWLYYSYSNLIDGHNYTTNMISC